jgi:hypothetical protein
MRWAKSSISQSFFGWLNASGSSEAGDTLQARTEDIRQSMLDSLGEDGDANYPQLTRRIRYAGDAQAMWYLRGELMAALSAMSSESDAAQHMEGITMLFRGLLPNALSSRPSPLQRARH